MNSSYAIQRWNQNGWFRASRYLRGILSLLVAALSLGLSLAGAPPELPSTPAGKVLAGYLEALNSGNKDKLETFVKAHRPDRPNALDLMLDLRWNTGGFDLHSIESSQALYRASPRTFRSLGIGCVGIGDLSKVVCKLSYVGGRVISNEQRLMWRSPKQRLVWERR